MESVKLLINYIRSLNIDNDKIIIMTEKIDLFVNVDHESFKKLYKLHIAPIRALIDNKKYDELMKIKFKATENFDPNILFTIFAYTNARQKTILFNLLSKINSEILI